jgi:hypothetical protein
VDYGEVNRLRVIGVCSKEIGFCLSFFRVAALLCG